MASDIHRGDVVMWDGHMWDVWDEAPDNLYANSVALNAGRGRPHWYLIRTPPDGGVIVGYAREQDIRPSSTQEELL